jgi:hypothetical protein
MRVTVDHRERLLLRTAFEHTGGLLAEPTGGVEPYAGNSCNVLHPARLIDSSLFEPLAKPRAKRPVAEAAKLVALRSKLGAEPRNTDVPDSAFPCFRQADGSFCQVMKRLVIRRNESNHLLSDAIFQSLLTASESFAKFRGSQSGQPFVAKAVTRYFVSGFGDPANLIGIVIGPGSPQGGRPHYREAGRHLKVMMELQEPVCATKLEVPPLLGPASTTGSICSPLRVVIPENKQLSTPRRAGCRCHDSEATPAENALPR